MSSKIASGVWFIFFGIVALLHNFNVIHFNFFALIDYWPLIIISIGANLILQNKKNGGIISFIINLAICIFLAFIGLTSDKRFNVNGIANFGNSRDTSNSSLIVSAPYNHNIQTAKLEFNLGAVSLQLDSIPSAELFEAQSLHNNVGLRLESKENETDQKIEVSTVVKQTNNDGKNNIHFALNAAPIWNIELNMGAASFKGDFTPYTFSKLAINSGAASLDLKLGMPKTEKALIEINTAASSCKIALPKDAAYFIENNSVLSSKSYNGSKSKEKLQKSANYDEAEFKYVFEINGAANSLSIERY